MFSPTSHSGATASVPEMLRRTKYWPCVASTAAQPSACAGAAHSNVPAIASGGKTAPGAARCTYAWLPSTAHDRRTAYRGAPSGSSTSDPSAACEREKGCV
jgi:hypothetical protein